MILPYFLFTMCCLYLGLKIYRNFLNPITIYFTPWFFMVLLYELKFVYYYELTLTTWSLVYLFHIVYLVGCFIGNKLNLSKVVLTRKSITPMDFRKKLKYIILTLCVISSLSILNSVINLFRIYGIDFIFNAQRIYGMRVSGQSGFQTIPYVGAAIYLAIPLLGIYISKYGTSLFMVIPLLLSIVMPFISGTRDEIISLLLLLIFSYYFSREKNKSKKSTERKTKAFVIIMIIVFLFVNSQRSAWVTPEDYMSPTMVELVKINPSIYKLYTYVSSPLGVLNAYIESPTYSFGKNTLLPIYGILNKLGLNIEMERYQTLYNIPFSSNVGTYIRELIEDYTIGLGILLLLMFSTFYSSRYKRTIKNKQVEDQLLSSIFSTIVALSFFVCYFRSSSYWIILFLAVPLGKYLDKFEINEQGGNK